MKQQAYQTADHWSELEHTTDLYHMSGWANWLQHDGCKAAIPRINTMVRVDKSIRIWAWRTDSFLKPQRRSSQQPICTSNYGSLIIRSTCDAVVLYTSSELNGNHIILSAKGYYMHMGDQFNNPTIPIYLAYTEPMS